MTDSLLPQIVDRSHYGELFKQNSQWDRAVAFLVDKHKLTGSVHRGILGEPHRLSRGRLLDQADGSALC